MADTWNLAPADAAPATTQSFTNANLSQALIEPQPNVLDKFASYTYQASVYLMTPDQYRNLINSNDKNIPDSQLLFQSGGKTVGNKFFDNDMCCFTKKTKKDFRPHLGLRTPGGGCSWT